MKTPEGVIEENYNSGSWQDYSEPEYRQWVDLLLKRSQHRSNLGKKIKDLTDAKNYMVMLIARLEELKEKQEKNAAERAAAAAKEAEKKKE